MRVISEGVLKQNQRILGSDRKGQISEEHARSASLTPPRYCVGAEENVPCCNNSVLIDKSKQYENTPKRFQSPIGAKTELDLASIAETSTKKATPLLQRLRIFKASRKSRPESPKKPLPQEVIVESDDAGGIAPAVTAFSELGVDGVSSARTLERRTPRRFTFDGVVPSQSSLDEVDIPPGNIVLTRSRSHEEEVFTALFTGFKQGAEGGGDVQSESMHTEEPLNRYHDDTDTKTRERSRSTSTSEMSIELSESQYLRDCDKEISDKYKIFSPKSSFPNEEQKMPIDHGFDSMIESSSTHNDEEKEKNETFHPMSWLDLGFLRLW